jgi:SAM-dependent methyltransferase
MSQASYDQIATVYATDMGQSMAFDDLGYYRQLCQHRAGATLELGCGTGRLLLPLLASGVDIEGIDQSPGMLQQLHCAAQALDLNPKTHLGSLTDFSVSRAFNTVLCPYSVLTYLTTSAELATCLQRIKQVLAPHGLLVLDTFIPQDVTPFDDFRLDYRRPHGSGILQREKRIAKKGEHSECNQIERRYTLFNADGATERTWLTCDLIRPYTETELIQSATAQGFTYTASCFDFDQNSDKPPQFVVLHFAAGI